MFCMHFLLFWDQSLMVAYMWDYGEQYISLNISVEGLKEG